MIRKIKRKLRLTFTLDDVEIDLLQGAHRDLFDVLTEQ